MSPASLLVVCTIALYASLQCSDDGDIAYLEASTNGTFVEQLLMEIGDALSEDLRPHFLKQMWWFFYQSFLVVFAAVDVFLVWFE